MNKLGIALALGMGVVLALAIYYTATLWLRLSNVEMGFHGWAAMIIGVVMSLALGIGLMFLIFYSNRKGYDDIERDE